MGATSSSTSAYSPFGHLPRGIAQLLFSSQLGPLLQGLGLGGTGGRGGKIEDQLAASSGPLAEFIKQVRGFAPNVIGQAQGVGNQVAGQGQMDYNTLRSQISSSLEALPEYQRAGNQNLGFAQQAVNDAFSPIRQSSIFQQTANNVLTPLRAGEAARGLESSGPGQQTEQNVLQNLGLNFAQNQLGQQQQALGGVGNALGQAQGLSSAGVGIAGQFAPALQNLQSQLSQRYLSPLQGAGGLLSLLSAGQTPGIQLTGATSPQLGTNSKGGGFWGCCHEDALVATPTGPRPISALVIGDYVCSQDITGLPVDALIVDTIQRTFPSHDFADLAGTFVSPDHPLADGSMCGDGRRRTTVLYAITCDIIVDSPTGYYCVGSTWLRSTIDSRHRRAA